MKAVCKFTFNFEAELQDKFLSLFEIEKKEFEESRATQHFTYSKFLNKIVTNYLNQSEIFPSDNSQESRTVLSTPEIPPITPEKNAWQIRKEKIAKKECMFLAKIAQVFESVKNKKNSDDLVVSFTDFDKQYDLVTLFKLNYLSKNISKYHCEGLFVKAKNSTYVYVKKFLSWLMQHGRKYKFLIKERRFRKHRCHKRGPRLTKEAPCTCPQEQTNLGETINQEYMNNFTLIDDLFDKNKGIPQVTMCDEGAV